MVRNIRRRAAILLIALGLCGPLLTAAAGDCAPARKPAVAKVVLSPYRALYRMSLHSARNSSKIADVRGMMMYEQGDVCDGWTTEQRFQLDFAYVEGDETSMVTNYTTWEAKDGLRYRFNVRKLVNGETDDEIRGSARLKKRGGVGSVHYLMPDTQSVALERGSLFPTAHTVALIERAERGERFFNRVVFDGADADGATEVSAVIGPPASVQTSVDSPLLRDKAAWPIRMAFFPIASGGETPDYEMSMKLLVNGVIGGMQIDYGDFIVDAVLEKIDTLPKPRC